MEGWMSALIDGINKGAIYALVALGYSMVYGIVKLINFAHGDIIMVGGYVMVIVMKTLGLPLPVAIAAAVLFCGLLGMLIEKVGYSRLIRKEAPRISLLITAIGMSLLLQNLAQAIFGANSQAMPTIVPKGHLPFLNISYSTIVTIVTAVVLMVALQMFVGHTRLGKAMRATSEDTGAAKLMGINTSVVIAFTFGIGSALAAVGSVLYLSSIPQVNPMMGSMLGLKAFVAAVLGGIGSIPGAMIGGVALGVAESLTTQLGLSDITDAVVFGILILVLVIKPSGLMGKNMTEKV